MVEPIACTFCDRIPVVVPIVVNYRSERRLGPHDMFRVKCACGAIGKCRPTAEAAAMSWNEPWQALIEREEAILAALPDPAP